MGCERRRATEAHTPRLRAGAAGAGSGEDQLALELGQPAEHGEQEPTVRCGRIGPGITERLEGGTGFADRVEDVEQVAGAPGKPVKPRDRQHIASLEAFDDLGQLRPVAAHATDLLRVDLYAAGGAELRIL